MKKVLLFVFVLIQALFVNTTLLAQYADSTLNGPWWANYYPLHIYNDDSINYLVFDGNGHILGGSMFCSTISGNYSVSASGAISGAFVCDGSPFPVSGQFSSRIFASISFGPQWGLSKITNPGALTDSLVGILYSASCGQKNVTLRLNSQGQIISASGFTSSITGRVYADSGHFDGHIITGEGGAWDQFTIIGAYRNDSLTGLLILDQQDCNGVVYLKRFGKISGTAPNGVSAQDVVVYPNPTTGAFTLTFPSETRQIQISGFLGQVLQTKYVYNEKRMNFELGNNGIYLIQVKTDRQIITKKIVICD